MRHEVRDGVERPARKCNECIPRAVHASLLSMASAVHTPRPYGTLVALVTRDKESQMQTIVVGVDTSDRASTVLATALKMAERYHAKLLIVRAVGLPVEFPLEALSISPSGLPNMLQDATQRGLERFVAEAKIPEARLLRAEARIGTPWQVLVDAAKEISADLVIVGTHGHSALDRLLGTTAARVVNHAPCSVLVVRPTPDGHKPIEG